MSINYQTDLNPQQLKVVNEADGPCLVLAGAGSGKTRTLIYRVAYLLEKGVPAENILLVTFTNKAARQMHERLIQLSSNSLRPSTFDLRPLWCGTFHHIANRILRRYAAAIGFTPSFGILDEEDSKKLLETCMEALDLEQKGRTPVPKPSVVRSILSFAANAKRPIAEVVEERYSSLWPYVEDLQKIHQRYQDQKQKANVMDFDDLLTKWLLLLASYEPARQSLQEQFRHILVDEYQDTNIIQAEIIRWLAGKHQNILVVGDDAQSIYGFRAAEIRNILDFPKLYPDTKTFYLEQNYRSTQPILDLANEIISHNFEQFPKKLFTERKSDRRPFVIETGDNYQQASFVVRQIQALSEEDGISANEIAVLFRARYQSARLELELTQKGISYVVRGGIRFFEQAHIKDVVAWLKILVNPKDFIAWSRILGLLPGIGPKSIQKIVVKLVEQQDPLQFFKKGDFVPLKAKPAFESLKKVPASFYPKKRQALFSLLEPLIQEWYLPLLPALYENSQERIEDLQQLLELAERYESIEEFVADVTLQESFRGEIKAENAVIARSREAATKQSHLKSEITSPSPPEADPPSAEARNDRNHIILSTIHQAKGLEWDVVFILSICDGQFPHSKVEEDSAEMEEERRLFYVASTRARNQLYLLYPRGEYSRQWGGLIEQNSTFLDELSGDVYERKELTSEIPSF